MDCDMCISRYMKRGKCATCFHGCKFEPTDACKAMDQSVGTKEAKHLIEPTTADQIKRLRGIGLSMVAAKRSLRYHHIKEAIPRLDNMDQVKEVLAALLEMIHKRTY